MVKIKEQIKEYIKKNYHLIIGIILCLFLLTISGVLAYTKSEEKEEVEPEENIETVEPVKEENQKVYVDIKGEVKKPGVYEVDKNYTIYQAIEKAGGLTQNANTDYINLSKRVTDEMAIIIYSKKEINDMKTDEEIKYQIKVEEKPCPDNLNDACLNKKSEDTTNKENTNTNSNTSTKVSLNKGTLEEFMTLSGIGESKAQAIIEYRNKNGEFKNIEEIKNVTGIGESIYEKIKDNLTL